MIAVSHAERLLGLATVAAGVVKLNEMLLLETLVHVSRVLALHCGTDDTRLETYSNAIGTGKANSSEP